MTETLRIGLDVSPLRYPFSGVRTYVEALLDVFRNGEAGIQIAPLAPMPGLTGSVNRVGRLTWDLHGVAESAEEARVDLLHMTRFAAPREFDGPQVVTVHDLIPLQLPEYRASPPAQLQTAMASRYVPRATRIIVPSTYVATQVHELLNVPTDRVDVIPMGVAPPPELESLPFLTGPYVLHAGGFDSRKNLPVLLRAFARASASLGPSWRLVLIGAPHSGNDTVYPPIQPEIERLGLSDRVLLTGRVSEREKTSLYRHAAVAVNPSLNEGFGLPILEAMSHSVPVVASNCTSHPEVAGDAALLVEPTEDQLANALVRLATDEGLRLDLAAKGRIRAAEFPWSRTAALTVATYRRAMADFASA